MKQLRAIGIGIIIWVIGVSIYTFSFYISILQDPELQANIFLFLGVLPLIWYGAKMYFKKDSTTKGYWVGIAFFLTATILDALITVPVFIIPNGGSYYQFFTDLGFWFIGFEFVAIAVLYRYLKVSSKKHYQII